MQENKKPKVRGRKVLFESKRFKVIEKNMEFTNGETETWEVVELKGNGGARVLPITNKQELVCIQEYRGAAEKYVLRFPTGIIEDGETPEYAAARELKEETGFVAEKLEPLGVLESTSGYYKSHALHVFVGTHLQQTGSLSREPAEQDMEIKLISLEKAFAMAEQAEFEDIQTVYTILLLKKHLAKQG